VCAAHLGYKVITATIKPLRSCSRGGWCHSGDIGFIDAEGYLHASGRKKSMIKSGGISIFPEEIEEVLLGHPQVEEVAVVGFNNQEWGEAVKAMVVLIKFLMDKNRASKI